MNRPEQEFHLAAYELLLLLLGRHGYAYCTLQSFVRWAVEEVTDA